MGRILRSRILDIEGDIDSGYSPCPDAGVSIVGVTTTVATYPTTAASFYAVNPSEVDGTPREGTAATYGDDTASVIYAFNVGSQIPLVGTRVICHHSGGRWLLQYDG